MLTIENIDKIKVGKIQIGKEKWEVKMIHISNESYNFGLRCIEASPASGLLREKVFSLIRKPIATAMDYSSNTYSMINIVSGKGLLINTKELKAPGLFVEQLVKLLEGC